MRTRLNIPTIFLLICLVLPGPTTETPNPNESSKYLDAVRTFADNVLKYGRDTYGPKHTPLFVDGLNIHTLEPVKWIAPNGDRWILSNLASQQNLFRVLDGLTKITGDPQYKQAAMDAIRYGFDNLRSPNGLLYWGHSSVHDALGDKVRGTNGHVLKSHHLHYELMWEVNADATRDFIESLWAAHILDWSNLDMNRIGLFNRPLRVSKGWNQKYKGGHVFFDSWPHNAFINTGTDLFHAAAFLAKQTGEKEPLIWAKRLAYRYVETRHPSTGISSIVYNQGTWANTNDQLLEDFKEHFVDPRTACFPPLRFSRPLFPNPNVYPWICYLLVGDMLDPEGKEFTQWALEELTAWGKFSYRREDNSFVPILTDGKRLEGYILKKDGFLGPKGMVVEAIPTEPHCFLAYSMAYRLTGDEFMWQMVRDMAHGYNLGEIGAQPGKNPDLNTNLDFQDPCLLLGFLELSERSRKREFLEMACRIGENILANQFHKGFFPLSKRHIYASFQALEPLALLYLQNEINSTPKRLPRVWPSMGACFTGPYRDREFAADTHSIYTLTESTEPPVSLQEAAFAGDVSKVRSLIVNGAEVNAKEWGSYLTVLQRAAMKGHEDVVKLLLAKGADIEAGKFHIGTALHRAAENGHQEISELLINNGADVNAKRGNGDTPLHSAARAGHKDIIELLIANGADINANNNEGQTPIDIALSRNRKDIVELLLAKGATISSIYVAAQMGNLAGAKTLLEQGVDLNAQDDKGFTPLHCAVQGSHKELAELLITKGADVNGKDKYGYSPLYSAIWNENKDIVKLLITKGADVNLKPEKDYPPLHYAVWNEDLDTVKLFVAQGAKFDVKDRDGWTAFRYATAQGNRDIVEFFISKGADASSFHMAACMGDLTRVKNSVEQGTDVDAKDELGWTPLYWAASTGQENIAELLIANGADVNAKTNYNSTPLYQAAATGRLNFVQLLIAKGADVNAKDKHGNTPLHSAASAGQRGVLELLISEGAIVDVKGRNGRTPLYNAALRSHKDIVEILVAKGADIDAKDKSDRTALHMAAMRGRKDVAEMLIEKGADVNVKEENGQTPLHFSVRQGHKDTTELLIDKGADVNARNKWDRTPLDIAVDQDHTEIIELLRRHTANFASSSEPVHDLAVTGVSALPRGLQAGGKAMDNVADKIFTGDPNATSRLGLRVLIDKDINGDGCGDMFIGAPYYKNIQGRVYIYYGGKDATFDVPDLTLTGEGDDNYFGHDIEVADFNNDGYSDLAITALGYNSHQGRVYLYYGGPDFNTAADKVFDGETGTAGQFGRRIAGGDINNDGCAELLVCADELNSKKGRVYLYYGAPSTDMDTICDLYFDGENPDDRFGKAALSLGKDVDGDGYGDVLMGTRAYPKGGKDGRVYLYWGADGTGMDNICDLIFKNQSPREQYAAFDVFDIDNDGFADIIIGAQGYDRARGRVHLHWGADRTIMDTTPDKCLTGERSGSLFGAEGIICGYVNNDDYGDILVPAVTYEKTKGRAYLFYGNKKSEIDAICDMIFTGENKGDRFASDIAVGDINGDNFADVLIGARFFKSESFQGRAYLYYGGPSSD